jgi:outer membrane protein assembly factor BamB
MGEVKTDTRQIVGVSTETGDERWRYEPDGGVRDVLFTEDVVVAVESVNTADSAVVRLDPSTGGEQWRYISDSIDPSIVFVGEAIHLFDGGSVVALNPETGSVIWRSAVAGAMGEISVDLHAPGGTLLAETQDGGEYSVAKLDTATGDPGWEAEIGGGVATIDRRESDGGDLYVGTDDGSLHRIAETTGRIRWTFEGGNATRVNASAAPILTGDGTAVYAVSADNGRTKWSAGFGSGRWVGLGGHSVVSEAVGGPIRVYDRDDGEVVLEKQDGPVAIGADTIFTVSGGVLGAYRLGRSDTARTETNAVAFCPNCGANLTTYDDPTFCPECGTETPE